MQIETTIRYHFMLVRMAVIKKQRERGKCGSMWRKGNPCALLVGMKIGAATMENSVKVTQKIKNSTSIRSSNSTCGVYPKEIKTGSQRDIFHPNIHCSIIYNSRYLENNLSAHHQQING